MPHVTDETASERDTVIPRNMHAQVGQVQSPALPVVVSKMLVSNVRGSCNHFDSIPAFQHRCQSLQCAA
jgi:hypothetical protein